MKTKTCTQCGIKKSLSEFYNHPTGKFGISAKCKECTKNYNKINGKIYYENNKIKWIKKRELNKEEIKNRMKKWYLDNKKILKIKQKNYYQKNKDKIKSYREKNKQRIFLKRKERLLKNKKKIAKQQKEWRLKNLLHTNQVQRKYIKNRYKTDINFKLECNLRTRMWFAIKKNIKSKRTLELLGCSIEFFKKYLESQFTEGMNWDNHTKKGWHIDHIKPCCTFNLSDSNQQEECFHYTNLQPLWSKDNLTKGKKHVKQN